MHVLPGAFQTKPGAALARGGMMEVLAELVDETALAEHTAVGLGADLEQP